MPQFAQANVTCPRARREHETVEARAGEEAEIVRKCLSRKDQQVRGLPLSMPLPATQLLP